MLLLLNHRHGRWLAGVTATLFFHATFFLTIRPDGGVGVASAEAAAPPSDERPRVFVVPFQRAGDYVSEMALSKIESYYRTLLSMSSDLEPTTQVVQPEAPKQATETPVALQQDKVLEAADKALWAGKDYLHEKKWRPAIKAFSAAIKRYERRIALLEDLDKLIEAQLLFALARFAQGYEDDGEEALARVMVLRPDLVVDRRWRSPSVDKAFERLREGLFRVPTGTLEVTCPVRECKVYVDGVLRGSDGAKVEGLPRGHHYVRVVAQGYEPWATRVFTPAKDAVRTVEAKARIDKSPRATTAAPAASKPEARVTPDHLAAFVREGNYGSDFLAKAGQFSEQSGADHLVMAFVNRVGKQYVVAAYLYSASRQQVAEVSKTLIQLDIADLQVKMVETEQLISMAIASFPGQRVVTETPPRVYARWEDPDAQKTAAAAEPPKTVAVAAPVPAPPSPPAQAPPAQAQAAQAQPAQAERPAQPYYGQPGYQPPWQPAPQPQQPQPAQQPVYQPQPTYGQPGHQPPPVQPGNQPPAQARPGDQPPAQVQQPAPAQAPPAQAPAAGQQVAQAQPPTQMRRPVVRESTPFTVVARAPASAVAPAQQGEPVVVATGDLEGDDDPVYEKWWFWTAVVGGAAAVAAAIAVPVALSGGAAAPTGANATVTWE